MPHLLPSFTFRSWNLTASQEAGAVIEAEVLRQRQGAGCSGSSFVDCAQELLSAGSEKALEIFLKSNEQNLQALLHAQQVGPTLLLSPTNTHTPCCKRSRWAASAPRIQTI
jgi:hypothetical protein